MSISVEHAGGRCLPAGCEPLCHISSEYPRLRYSKVRGAQRLPCTGKVCGLIIWSVDEDDAAINHPIFISPAWRVAIEVAGDE